MSRSSFFSNRSWPAAPPSAQRAFCSCHRRREAAAALKRGQRLGAAEQQLARFTLVDVFADPKTRRLTLTALAMATTTTLAWWGISTWVPPYIASVAGQQGLPAQRWASPAGMAYNLGGIVGCISLGFFADALGRRAATMTWYALSLLMTPVLFVWTQNLSLLLVVCAINAFFTIGQFTWCST
ncbi:MAG TPA: hypothetical protein VNN17_01290 [Terriglobia bacterium]|nr:hypothetical protein [Terriglobia bacterium]